MATESYDIREIKESNPIEELIAEDITLKKIGKDKFGGLCPFHDDHKPSLVVYSDTQSFYCFGCQAHGDVIDYVQNKRGLSFLESLKFLAERVNILPVKISSEEIEESKEKRTIKDILTETAYFYNRELLENSDKKKLFMKSRNFTEETVQRYLIGIAGDKDKLTKYLLSKGYDIPHILKAGVCETKEGKTVDYFNQRYIFPITKNGKVIFLTGRSIGNQLPKWKHLKGELSCFFNESSLNKQEIFLTEGIPDTLTLLQNGYDSVGILGVNNFNERHLSRFKQVSSVYISFDNDRNNSGQNAAKRIGEMLAKRGLQVKIVNIPREKDKESADVNDSFLDHPVKDFQKLIKAARDITKQGSLKIVSSKIDMMKFTSPFGHTYRVSNILTDGKGIKAELEISTNKESVYRDWVILSSGYSRTRFANKVQEMSDRKIKSILLEKELLTITTNIREILNREILEHREVDQYSPTDKEKEEALDFLKSPNIMERIVEDMEKLGYTGESVNKQMAYIIATSRKLEKPISGVIKAQSASGKSELVKTVLKLMPEEEYLDLSRVTEQALFYMSTDELKHKMVVIMEKEGSESANYSIRQLQSEQKLTLLVPVKNLKTGVFKTIPITVEGPIAYMETTTQAQLPYGNTTRMFNLYMDETEEQTERIQKKQRRDRLLRGLNDAEKKHISRIHKNAQRLLKTYKIVIPYADKLLFPTNSIRTRRDNERFLNLIETITLLRQYQKEVKVIEGTDVQYIEADLKDYEIAYNLATVVLSQTLDEISKESRELLKLIKSMVNERFEKEVDSDWESPEEIKFTRKDIRKYTDWKDSVLYEYIKELENMEYLEVIEGKMGKPYVYRYAYEGNPEMPHIRNLLTPEKLEEKINNER